MQKRIRCIVFLILFCVLGGINLKAQSPFDSLLILSQTETNQIKKCDAYLNYIEKLGSLYNDSAVQLLIVSENDYQKVGNVYGVGRCKSLRAWLIANKGELDVSLKLANEAIVFQSKINDSLGIALTFLRMGVSLFRTNQLNNAEKVFIKSYKYFLTINDTENIDNAISCLGTLYTQQKKYDKAINLYNSLLKMRLVKSQYDFIGDAYYELGESFLNNQQIDSAKYYLLLAHHTFIEKSAYKTAPPKVSIALGRCYFQLKEYNKALIFTEAGIKEADRFKSYELLLSSNQLLHQILAKMGKFKEAYLTQQNYFQLKEHIDSLNKTNESEFVLEHNRKLDDTSETLKLEILRLDAENKLQTFRVVGISIVSTILLFIAAFVIIYQQKNQVK